MTSSPHTASSEQQTKTHSNYLFTDLRQMNNYHCLFLVVSWGCFTSPDKDINNITGVCEYPEVLNIPSQIIDTPSLSVNFLTAILAKYTKALIQSSSVSYKSLYFIKMRNYFFAMRFSINPR